MAILSYILKLLFISSYSSRDQQLLCVFSHNRPGKHRLVDVYCLVDVIVLREFFFFFTFCRKETFLCVGVLVQYPPPLFSLHTRTERKRKRKKKNSLLGCFCAITCRKISNLRINLANSLYLRKKNR